MHTYDTCTYIHTHIYKYIYTYTCTYIHTYIHKYMYINTYIHVHTYTCTYIQYIHVHTYTVITHIHTYTHVFTYIHIINTGYDTMTTSPASTRSSYSSTTHHGISQHLNSPPAPTTSPPQNNLTQLTQLLPDPVKLIDERIKVNQYCVTIATP